MLGAYQQAARADEQASVQMPVAVAVPRARIHTRIKRVMHVYFSLIPLILDS